MPRLKGSFKANRIDFGVNLQSNLNLKQGELSDGHAIRYIPGGGVFTGPGYQLKVTTGSNVAGEGLRGGSIFRAIWMKSGTKLYYSDNPDDGVSYDTGLTFTTGTVTDIIESIDGDILVTNVDDSPVRIAVARATVAIADSDVTITVGADHISKFASSGDVIVNGDTIAYTGKGATTLTGVTGIQSGGHVINSLVIQTSNPGTWTQENGAFGFIFEKRLLVGGVKDTETVLSYSAPVHVITSPELIYDFDANGTGSHFFPDALVAGITGTGNAYVFMRNRVHQLLGFDITRGDLLERPVTEHYGAYNKNCVVDMDGIVAFLGNRRLMPIILQLGATGGSVPVLSEDFDHRLRPWLETFDDFEDQGDAFLHYNHTTKILKIGGRVKGAMQVRGFDRQAGAYFPIELRPGYQWTTFNGESYFLDTIGRLHLDDVGRTNAGNGVYHEINTGRMESEEGGTHIMLGKLKYSGFMSQALTHKLRIFIDGKPIPAANLDYDDSIADLTSPIAVGSRGVGVSTIAGDTGSYKVFPYKNTVILRGIAGEDIKIRWSTYKEGGFLQIDNYELEYFVTRRDQLIYT